MDHLKNVPLGDMMSEISRRTGKKVYLIGGFPLKIVRDYTAQAGVTEQDWINDAIVHYRKWLLSLPKRKFRE